MQIWLRPGARPESISPILENGERLKKKRWNTYNQVRWCFWEIAWIYFSPQKSVLRQLEVRPCTINSDDPLLFGPRLLEEFQLCRDQYLDFKREGDRGRIFWTSTLVTVSGSSDVCCWYWNSMRASYTKVQKLKNQHVSPNLLTVLSWWTGNNGSIGLADPIGGNRRWTYSLAVFQQHHSKVEDVRRSTCSLCSLLVATNPHLWGMIVCDILLIVLVVIAYDAMITTH